MGRASGDLDTSHWIRNDIPDFQGEWKGVSVENRKVCNQTTTRKRLEGDGEVLMVDKMDGFGPDFFKIIKKGFRSTTTDMGAVL